MRTDPAAAPCENGRLFVYLQIVVVYLMEAPRIITYEPPVAEVIEIKSEGIVCASGGLTDYNRNSNPDTW